MPVSQRSAYRGDYRSATRASRPAADADAGEVTERGVVREARFPFAVSSAKLSRTRPPTPLVRASDPLKSAPAIPENAWMVNRSRRVDATPLQLLKASEGDLDIYCWRVEVLERVGYTGAFAHWLAEDTAIDLHQA